MKGIICYYSGSGNTKLAANCIKKKIKNADFELCDIVKNDTPDLSKNECWFCYPFRLWGSFSIFSLVFL